LVEACRHFTLGSRADTLAFIDELSDLALPRAGVSGAVDRRVQGALVRLRGEPGRSLDEIARDAELSLSRLSRLVTQGTGMRLRQHVLWNRLLAVLSSTQRFEGIAAAASAAGFADHAHLTRTFRAFLGRAPSELGARLDVIEPW
jgi:AraC-like DNA-binding protein